VASNPAPASADRSYDRKCRTEDWRPRGGKAKAFVRETLNGPLVYSINNQSASGVHTSSRSNRHVASVLNSHTSML
jgi:hypothetical protein